MIAGSGSGVKMNRSQEKISIEKINIYNERYTEKLFNNQDILLYTISNLCTEIKKMTKNVCIHF